MNKRFINISILSAVTILTGLVSSFAKEPTDAKKSPLRKIAGEPLSTLSNVNNFSMWTQADGMSGNDFITGKSRTIFPRGTALVIAADGIVWAGLVNDGQLPRLRAGGRTYLPGTIQGAILGERTGIAEDPASADVRIWRIREDWATADLLQDAAESFDVALSAVTDAQISAVRAQYGTDWDEWPAVKGAPYYDDNGDGIFDPTIDRPGLAGADQVIWFVSNDLDTAIVANFLGSPPIGIENQVTVWAYASEGRLGDIIFRRNRLIYKGTVATPSDATIDSMYFNLFSEPDIGDFGDDFVGVDTLINTGYAYNSSDIDAAFIKFSLAPPSAGYTLIQGPIVPSIGDKAIQDFSVRQDFKNLPLSAFGFNRAGDSISDPPHGRYEGTIGFYNVMHGLIQDGIPFIDPNTNEIAIFTLAGDPVAGTGWIDERPSNRVFEMSTGPFSMALGDTQEVIIALVGGIGGGRFESIVEMKKAARLALSLGQNMFSEIPEADLNITYPSGSEANLNLTVNAHGTATEVIVEIYNYDNVLQETLTLLDDGNNGDGAANDSIWGVEWLTDQRVFGMYANALIVSGTDTARWEHILDNITTLGPVEWDELIIVTDNINEDGIINSGEKVVFNPSINNGSFLSILGDVTIGTFLFDEYVIAQNAPKKTEVESIQSGITQLGDTFSRYFVMADDTPDGHLLKLRFSIVDKNHNVWVSELEVRVSEISFSTEISSAEHAEGTATGTIGYRIADPSALTSETYEVTFNEVESVFSFNLQNLTTSTLLLTSEPIPDDEFSSTVPITEGFKITFDDFTFEIPKTFESAEFTFDADPTDGDLVLWGDGTLFGRVGFYRNILNCFNCLITPYPTIDLVKVDLQFRFTGVALDNDSPVTSGGSYSTQWERAAFGGDGTEANVQLRIPFELWDLEGNDGAGRQIEVAVINRNADSTAPYGNDVGTTSTARWRMSGRDYIIVINEDYADDPNKLRSIVNQNTTWVLFFQQAGASVWSTGDIFTLEYNNPIQAGIDVYHFQVPTELEALGIAETFLLSQNYPNPFNPETTIQYSLPMQSDVKLLIYNLLGQEVFRFEIAGQKIGEYEVVWNGKNQRGNELSSGLYIYKFSAGDFVQTKKMLLLK